MEQESITHESITHEQMLAIQEANRQKDHVEAMSHAISDIKAGIANARGFPIRLPAVAKEVAEKVLPEIVTDPERYVLESKQFPMLGCYGPGTQLWSKEAWEAHQKEEEAKMAGRRRVAAVSSLNLL